MSERREQTMIEQLEELRRSLLMALDPILRWLLRYGWGHLVCCYAGVALVAGGVFSLILGEDASGTAPWAAVMCVVCGALLLLVAKEIRS